LFSTEQFTFLQRPPIVLLTGPAGAGKSALVQVLSKELGCELKEWMNPVTDSYGESSFFDKRNNWSGRVLFF
jgi:cell cycle checkpoint protein